MEISGSASLMIQANSLDSVRSTLAAAKAAPNTPAAQQAVILDLSVAAQSLVSSH